MLFAAPNIPRVIWGSNQNNSKRPQFIWKTNYKPKNYDLSALIQSLLKTMQRYLLTPVYFRLQCKFLIRWKRQGRPLELKEVLGELQHILMGSKNTLKGCWKRDFCQGLARTHKLRDPASAAHPTKKTASCLNLLIWVLYLLFAILFIPERTSQFRFHGKIPNDFIVSTAQLTSSYSLLLGLLHILPGCEAWLVLSPLMLTLALCFFDTGNTQLHLKMTFVSVASKTEKEEIDSNTVFCIHSTHLLLTGTCFLLACHHKPHSQVQLFSDGAWGGEQGSWPVLAKIIQRYITGVCYCKEIMCCQNQDFSIAEHRSIMAAYCNILSILFTDLSAERQRGYSKE